MTRSNIIHHRGITLIEIMMVMALLAIISTIAVGSYRNYVMRAQRTEAKSALLRIQVAEEKFFLQKNIYTTDIITAPPGGLGIGSDTTPGGKYKIVVDPDPSGTNNIATSYRATVTAIGGQTQDTKCLTFTINDRGQRTPDESTGCWR